MLQVPFAKSDFASRPPGPSATMRGLENQFPTKNVLLLVVVIAITLAAWMAPEYVLSRHQIEKIDLLFP
jgi:hypothetical protein